MSVAIKNIQIGSSVNLYLTGSDSELSSDEDNYSIRRETETLYVEHSLQTDCIALDDSTHSRLKSFPKITKADIERASTHDPRPRKRPRVLSSDEDSQPEIASRSLSPEIPYGGSPVSYKLRELKGEFLIIKIPMNKQKTRSKKCSEQDIANMINTESEDEIIFESLKQNGANVVGSLPCDRLTDASRKEIPTRPARSCRSRSKDTIFEGKPKDSESSEEDEEEHVPLRIKLRRSTEQSNYKVQTIFDSDAGTRRSSRRSNAATPKRCAWGDCKEDDHGSRKKSRASSKTPTSFTVSAGNRAKAMREPVEEEVEMPDTIGSRLRAYGMGDWKRDDREMSERLKRGERLGPKRMAKTPQKSVNTFEEATTPRSLRTRRSSKQFNYNEHSHDDSDNNLNKENQSENDLEEDSDSVTSRGRTRQQSSKLVMKTPRKGEQIMKEPTTPKRTPSKRMLPDLDEDSDSVTPRNRTRQHLSKLTLGTPRQGKQIPEEPSTSKRTPRKGVLSDAEQETTNCGTPRTSGLRKIREEAGTPTTPRGRRISKLANTPSRGNLTPSMTRRTANIHKPITVLGEARAKLHVSAVPKSLPCREQEFNDIYQFLERKLLDNNSGCIYISGVPGTGKTATVNEAIRCLKKLVAKGDLENFDFVEINGMKLSEPRQAYVQILKQINGQTTTWEGAYNILDTRFTRSSAKRPMMLLLVDELDLLCTKRQDVVYNLLDWPAKENARLVVITIANTMDLPERVLMGRVTSRLGLTRLTFQPYNHKQLQEIVTARLKDSDAFKSDAIELVARKVGAVSGDARRALDICRRATEIAELREEKIVCMKDVNEALREMIASFKVQAIRHRSEMEKMFLRAVSAEVTRTGVEETNFDNVYLQLQSLCSFEGLEIPNVTQALGICGRLGASRLLLCEHSRSDIQQRILLNVSMDDLHFAMNIDNLA